MSSFRDVDRGANALLRRMKKRPVVRVGVMGSEASSAKKIRNGDGFAFTSDTVADIASQHEFGIGVPKRSFIADWADESEPDARRRLSKIAKRITDRSGLEWELERFGLWAVGQIQMRISRRIAPPLAQATEDRKGSDVPLIDTNQLRSSVTQKVVIHG